MGFTGHQNYGQYAGDYVTSIKDLTAFGQATAGRQGFNQMQRYQAKKELESAIDSGNVSMDMGIVPDKYKEQVEEFIQKMAREKGQLEINMMKLKESGQIQNPEYLKMKAKADSIRRALGPQGTLSTQFKKLNDGAAEFLEDKMDGAISLMAGSDNEYILAKLFANSLELQIDESGMLSFGELDKGFTALDSMPEYFNADYTNAGKLLAQTEEVFKAGKKLNDSKKLFYRNSFRELTREGGRQTILSLAFDPLLSTNSLLREQDYEQEIIDLQSDDATTAGAAYDKIQKDLEDAYMKLLGEHADNGYAEQNPETPSSERLFSSLYDDKGVLTVDIANIPQRLQKIMMLNGLVSKSTGMTPFTGFKPHPDSTPAKPLFTFKDREGDQMYSAGYTLEEIETLLTKLIK